MSQSTHTDGKSELTAVQKCTVLKDALEYMHASDAFDAKDEYFVRKSIDNTVDAFTKAEKHRKNMEDTRTHYFKLLVQCNRRAKFVNGLIDKFPTICDSDDMRELMQHMFETQEDLMAKRVQAFDHYVSMGGDPLDLQFDERPERPERPATPAEGSEKVPTGTAARAAGRVKNGRSRSSRRTKSHRDFRPGQLPRSNSATDDAPSVSDAKETDPFVTVDTNTFDTHAAAVAAGDLNDVDELDAARTAGQLRRAASSRSRRRRQSRSQSGHRQSHRRSKKHRSHRHPSSPQVEHPGLDDEDDGTGADPTAEADASTGERGEAHAEAAASPCRDIPEDGAGTVASD